MKNLFICIPPKFKIQITKKMSNSERIKGYTPKGCISYEKDPGNVEGHTIFSSVFIGDGPETEMPTFDYKGNIIEGETIKVHIATPIQYWIGVKNDNVSLLTEICDTLKFSFVRSDNDFYKKFMEKRFQEDLEKYFQNIRKKN